MDDGGSSFTNWYTGEPDGGDSQNCMAMSWYEGNYEGSWNDIACNVIIDAIDAAVCSKRITTASSTSL